MPRPKKFKELNETFNIDVTSTSIETVKEDVAVTPINKVAIIEKDSSFVFDVLTKTIAKSQEALDSALELAQETDSARAYEVVGQLVKHTVDSAEKIIDIHRKLKEIETGEKSNSPTNVTNNAVFVGTTAEALKLLKATFKDSES